MDIVFEGGNMEAKDTVIGKIVVIPVHGDKIDITPHLETQAEISFKAGLELGAVLANAGHIGDYKRAKQEGRREVVDFIQEGGYLMGDEWQAFLEERLEK